MDAWLDEWINWEGQISWINYDEIMFHLYGIKPNENPKSSNK